MIQTGMAVRHLPMSCRASARSRAARLPVPCPIWRTSKRQRSALAAVPAKFVLFVTRPAVDEVAVTRRSSTPRCSKRDWSTSSDALSQLQLLRQLTPVEAAVHRLRQRPCISLRRGSLAPQPRRISTFKQAHADVQTVCRWCNSIRRSNACSYLATSRSDTASRSARMMTACPTVTFKLRRCTSTSSICSCSARSTLARNSSRGRSWMAASRSLKMVPYGWRSGIVEDGLPVKPDGAEIAFNWSPGRLAPVQAPLKDARVLERSLLRAPRPGQRLTVLLAASFVGSIWPNRRCLCSRWARVRKASKCSRRYRSSVDFAIRGDQSFPRRVEEQYHTTDAATVTQVPNDGVEHRERGQKIRFAAERGTVLQQAGLGGGRIIDKLITLLTRPSQATRWRAPS